MINTSLNNRCKAIEKCIYEYVRLLHCTPAITGVEAVLCLPAPQYLYMQTLDNINSPHPAMVYTYFLWIRYAGRSTYSQRGHTGLHAVWYASYLRRAIHDE